MSRLVGKVSCEADADDGKQVRIEEIFKLCGEIGEEVKSPLGSRHVFALSQVVIGFIRDETIGASIIVSGFAVMQAFANR